MEAIGFLLNIPINPVEKKHIVVVCGEPRVLAEIKMGLMEYFDVSIAAASHAAIAALEIYKAVAVVIYIGENRNKSFEEFGIISEFVKDKSVPVMFLAETDAETDENYALESGAADYIIRRKETSKALISRINQQVRAYENEKRLIQEKSFPQVKSITPEEVLFNKTILIADDIELNKEIIAGMLSGIDGLNIEFADNGSDAVEKFRKTPGIYSLIFMDVLMPVMDGLEATKAIRNLNCENSRGIPIIALSASVEENEITSCLESGMNDFIEKPMSYDRLIATVSKYCK